MTDQEAIKQERKATADLYMKQAAEIERLTAALKEISLIAPERDGASYKMQLVAMKALREVQS